MGIPFLGGLTADAFLAEYWQKKPLLVKQAFPGFTGLIGRNEMLALACHPDAEARLVECREGAWAVQRSPFRQKDIGKKRKHPWAMLVQGLNLFQAEAERFMRQFSFIPWARLDDLMVSYAVDGGGVGPHYDDYDVFIVQGLGRRLWQVGPQEDKRLIEDAPLKILRNFKPAMEWLLEPGDMIYLPPDWAHNGIAIGECMNYSIGFRSPRAQELAYEFLSYIQDRIDLPGLYADPQLKQQAHPAEIGEAMVSQVAEMIAQVRWDRDDVNNFLGCYLSEPKPHIYFTPPEEPLSRQRFRAAWRKSGLSLDPRTQMLFSGDTLFVNGEPVPLGAGAEGEALRRLADERHLAAPDGLSQDALDRVYEWYEDGFLFPSTSGRV